MTEAMLSGTVENGVHRLMLRVYWEDTDAGGFVYHANYLKFCERARSDFLRLMGVRQSAMGNRLFVVRRMVCDFLRPARLDDLLAVQTCCQATAGARLELRQRVSLKGEVLFAAAVTVAFVDRAGHPRRLPAEIRALFDSPFESAP
jgi:acyl-CoA thioester hydrolase